MVDQHPFLFEALAQINNNTFLFQQHLKATWSFTTPNLCVFSSFQATNGSTSRFHLRVSTPSYPLWHVFWWDIRNPSCSNFIMFWPRGKFWFTTRPVFQPFNYLP
jgi:hypothetical protein